MKLLVIKVLFHGGITANIIMHSWVFMELKTSHALEDLMASEASLCHMALVPTGRDGVEDDFSRK